MSMEATQRWQRERGQSISEHAKARIAWNAARKAAQDFMTEAARLPVTETILLGLKGRFEKHAYQAICSTMEVAAEAIRDVEAEAADLTSEAFFDNE